MGQQMFRSDGANPLPAQMEMVRCGCGAERWEVHHEAVIQRDRLKPENVTVIPYAAFFCASCGDESKAVDGNPYRLYQKA